MIAVEEASQIINDHLFNPTVITAPLDECFGHVLSEDIKADRDFPPFDRVMMDGLAIAFEAFLQGRRTFELEATQLAGMPQLTLSHELNGIEVMTGAMLPKGTDTVIRYEDIEIKDGKATITVDELSKGQHVHQKGKDVPQGKLLLTKGTRLSTAEIGVLATVGKAQVSIYKPMKIAIVATGDELVAVEDIPKVFQIRQSNSHVLKAALKSFQMEGDIFHLVDDRDTIYHKIDSVFKSYDAIILSGGVSKGKKDYVPEVLEALGVVKHFHGVKQRPGKPFWFGTRANKAVFALPGNPVSTYLCFYKYIMPWLNLSFGLSQAKESAILMEDFNFNAPLTYFLQVRLQNDGGLWQAHPVEGQGSGDLANLLWADGFLELAPQQTLFKKGEVYPIIRYRSI